MSPLRATLLSIPLLYGAAILQQALAPRMAIFGVQPDFFLILLVPLALVAPASVAAPLGFASGVIHGAVAGANLPHYAISRGVAFFAAILSRGVGLEIGLPLAGLLVGLATVIAQIVLMFLAPPPAITPFLAATMGVALYDGVLALPIYALLRRSLRSKAI